MIAENAIRDTFILLALLIIGAYFVGIATDANSFFNGVSKFAMVVSGRNPATGNFAPYPTGQNTVQGG